MDLNFKLLDFLRWVYVDIITSQTRSTRFKPYGLTVYCGRQGAGKTVSMVEYANRIRAKYPDCIIVANFSYIHADFFMSDWRDLLQIRNGTKGVLFLIDEIHSEYSSQDWKDFPENLLSEISMQRKQKIKICATSQVYSRVVKQIREQTFSVIQCFTFADRWTFTREYDAIDYEIMCDNPEKRKKLRPIKRSFVQDDYLRKCYDTYEKIKRMKKISEKPKGKGFIPRNERMA
jgi:ATP-dependent Clp protease ATP-binding subunit ClpX